MADESYPEELKYFKEHDWVRVDGDEAVLGITWFAQDALGEIVYVELPEVGAALEGGQAYGQLESVKAVSDVFAPVGGEVTDVNSVLEDEPQLVNDDPYGDGWLIRVRLSQPDAVAELMDAEAYRTFLDQD